MYELLTGELSDSSHATVICLLTSRRGRNLIPNCAVARNATSRSARYNILRVTVGCVLAAATVWKLLNCVRDSAAQKLFLDLAQVDPQGPHAKGYDAFKSSDSAFVAAVMCSLLSIFPGGYRRFSGACVYRPPG